MSPVVNASPLPDPWSTPVGQRLLAYKDTLTVIVKHVRPNLDPKKILRKDIEDHIRALDDILRAMEKIMNSSRNRPLLDQCLKSAVAVREQVAEARRQLWSALIPVDSIHSPTASTARQMESAVELDKALGKCRSSLKGAISQFRT